MPDHKVPDTVTAIRKPAETVRMTPEEQALRETRNDTNATLIGSLPVSSLDEVYEEIKQKNRDLENLPKSLWNMTLNPSRYPRLMEWENTRLFEILCAALRVHGDYEDNKWPMEAAKEIRLDFTPDSREELDERKIAAELSALIQKLKREDRLKLSPLERGLALFLLDKYLKKESTGSSVGRTQAQEYRQFYMQGLSKSLETWPGAHQSQLPTIFQEFKQALDGSFIDFQAKELLFVFDANSPTEFQKIENDPVEFYRYRYRDLLENLSSRRLSLDASKLPSLQQILKVKYADDGQTRLTKALYDKLPSKDQKPLAKVTAEDLEVLLKSALE